MRYLCEAQQRALDLRRSAAGADAGLPMELLPAVRQGLEHGMPPLPAAGLPRAPWREILSGLCAEVGDAPGFPAPVAATRLRAADPQALEHQADALLLAAGTDVDPAAAPFVMAALQVYWTLRGRQLPAQLLERLPPAGRVYPLCGSLPLASLVHADPELEGCGI